MKRLCFRPRLLLLLCVLVAPPLVAETVAVTVQPLSALSVTPDASAPAEVMALNRATIGAEIGARITALHVEVGDRVDKGARLVSLDCRDAGVVKRQLRAARDGIEARLELADYQLDKASSLASRKALSEEVLHQRETAVATLRAERAGIEAQLAANELRAGRCTVHAPFPAVVVARMAQLGEQAAPGAPLFTLLDTSRVELLARVRRADLDALASAGGLRFVESGRAYPVTTRVTLPQVDGRSDAVEMRLRFDTAPPAPGTTGRLVWTPTARSVPAGLLESRDGRLGIFVLDGDVARFHPLDGASEGRPAVVDLPPETLLIVDGRAGARDGDAVRVTD